MVQRRWRTMKNILCNDKRYNRGVIQNNKLKRHSGDQAMTKKALVLILFLSAVFFSGATFGEEATVADPKRYIVELENDKVRVIRVKYGPGEKSVMHTHGPNVAVFLSDSTVRMHLPDGSTVDVVAESGNVVWAENEEHQPENMTDEAMEVLLIEVKD
jgi:quercetin dioxygenase-like cupin family protein